MTGQKDNIYVKSMMQAACKWLISSNSSALTAIWLKHSSMFNGANNHQIIYTGPLIQNKVINMTA